MAESPSIESVIESAKKSGIATEPIFVANFENAPVNVSWEVSDGTLPEPEEPREPEENLPEEKQDEEEPPRNEEEDSLEEEEPESKKRPRKRNTAEKRIADLTRQLKQEQYEKQQAWQQAEHFAKIAESKDKEAEKHYENVIKNSISTIEDKLADALEEGDSKAIAHYTKLMAQYGSEERNIQTKKTVQPYYNPPAPPPPQQYQDDYRIPDDHPYKEVGDEWAARNDWTNPDSKNFNKLKYAAADEYSIILAERYKKYNLDDEIGSPEFFDQIDIYMEREFPGHSQSTPSQSPQRQKMQMKESPSTVSSVNRPSVNNEATRASREIQLTAEQREMAHKMRGYVRDEKNNLIYDNPTLEKYYKKHMKNHNFG